MFVYDDSGRKYLRCVATQHYKGRPMDEPMDKPKEVTQGTKLDRDKVLQNIQSEGRTIKPQQ